MTIENMGSAECTKCMGPLLRNEVESQLLKDLVPYGIDPKGLAIDWSGCCNEGHRTEVLDGSVENFSGITVLNLEGQAVAEGWMEFIHGGGNNPLFVFWEDLIVVRDGKKVEVKGDINIPGHIWAILPEKTKSLCAKTNEYDANWGNDPLVLAWKRLQSKS